jgi:hypothetical protein
MESIVKSLFCQSPPSRATIQGSEGFRRRLTSQSRALKLGPMMTDCDAILGINDRSSQFSGDRLEGKQLPNTEGEKDGGLLRARKGSPSSLAGATCLYNHFINISELRQLGTIQLICCYYTCEVKSLLRKRSPVDQLLMHGCYSKRAEKASLRLITYSL